MRKNKGITLIALVITIIVLLILAAVSIAMLIGENGILSQANKAKIATEEAAKKEQEDLEELLNYMNEYGSGTSKDEEETDLNIPNEPVILTGMKKVMFQEATKSEKGKVIKEGETGFNSDEWYNYKEKKWANASTDDGSLWVWIPRYAYKIKYNNPNNKSEGGTIDVKFLNGTGDTYYDEKGELKTAKRASDLEEGEIADTTVDYYVHPAFTDESNLKNKFENGGWDKELTGIWVAKFEAAYPTSNGNKAPVKESINTYYTSASVWGAKIEVGEGAEGDANISARNWLDGEYGVKNADGSFSWKSEQIKIKYPTFQGSCYSMNYIGHNDAYNISKALTEEGNIYNLSNNDADSHLIKNSEWGAIVYLSDSRYGQEGIKIAVNRENLENGGVHITKSEGNQLASVYAVTGYNDSKKEWNDYLDTNQKSASTTGNIYGVYDLSGGLTERTSGYVANGNEYLNNRKKFGI